MKKYKVGLLTLSDGREYLHRTQLSLNMEYQNRIRQVLEQTGLVEVVAGNAPIHSNSEARVEALKLRSAGVELTIFNYAIWCYPQYTVVAAQTAPGPFLLFCNIHPSECGMVGMMAAAGALDQLATPYERVWGDIRRQEVLSRVMACIRGGCAVSRLRGNTYGNFGGRAMGMYTASSNLDQWQTQFGIDVENIEQYDIVRYGHAISEQRVLAARQWLEAYVGRIAYNSTNFTPEKLETQIRSYLALRKIIAEKQLDFIGIKAHGDLTDWYVTMDLAEAFLNDAYDWDGPHEPIVAATESDMDGALTMQLFKYMSGMPVLFADVRHYEQSENIWFFSNSGTSATYYAGKPENFAENLKEVSLLPESKDYPAGGGSVQYFSAPGAATFARLTRLKGKYRLTLVPAEIVRLDRERMERLGRMATPQWPITFAKLSASAEAFLKHYPCNHIHGVYGNYLQEWLFAAKILGIDVQILGQHRIIAD